MATTPTPPRHAGRHARLLTALAVAILAATMAWLAVGSARRIVSLRTERQGTVTVSRCDFSNFGRHANTYSCVGAFTSETDDLRVPVVRLPHTGALRRGERVTVTVAGRDDDTATVEPVGGVVWWLVGTAAAAAALAAAARLLVRIGRHRRSG
jgi:hypothetical protein